ncbi:MAG: MFS transporter [Chloroflexi bacterium RBG_16_48_8]|nr:MAG: MFS transporter [Chloroflexi bacterium RBG_16_48_8]
MGITPLKQASASNWQRTLWIIFFAQMMTAVGFSSINPFLPLYVKDLGSSTNLSIELLAGLVYSAQAFTMMFAAPIWGTIADRYGRKLMVERSMFGGAIILLLMAFVSSAEQLILLRAIQGVITGTVAASSALVASIAPRKRMGFAMGLLQVGLNSGVALGPVICGVVADAFGYSSSFYVTSALLLIAGVIIGIGVHEEFTPKEALREQGNKVAEKWRRILLMPGVGMTYSVRFMAQLGRMMVIPILSLFALELLPDAEGVNTFTGLVIGAGAATMTLSGIYLGRLGDQIGHRRVLIACFILAGLLYLPQSLVTQGWQLLVLYALVGIGSGGIVPLVSALLANYTPAGEEGAVYGLDNSIQSGARSLSPLLGSAVALWFGLRSTFIATALVFFLGAVLAIWRLPQQPVDQDIQSEI